MRFTIFDSFTGQIIDTVSTESEALNRTRPGSGLDYSPVRGNSRPCFCDYAYHPQGC